MLIRNSQVIGAVTNALRNVDIDVELDVPRAVEDAISMFNMSVDYRFKQWSGGPFPRPLFTVLAPAANLGKNDRDIFESVLLSYAHWSVLAGDRKNILFGVESDYTKEELDKYLFNYMIYSGRFCNRCKVFTEYKPNKGIWVCPECRDRVGCHKGTDIAFGSVANQATSDLRKKLHLKVDKIWKTGIMTRSEVYSELSKLLGVHKCYTHIAMLGYNQCMIVNKWASAVQRHGGVKCQEEG